MIINNQFGVLEKISLICVNSLVKIVGKGLLCFTSDFLKFSVMPLKTPNWFLKVRPFCTKLQKIRNLCLLLSEPHSIEIMQKFQRKRKKSEKPSTGFLNYAFFCKINYASHHRYGFKINKDKKKLMVPFGFQRQLLSKFLFKNTSIERKRKLFLRCFS